MWKQKLELEFMFLRYKEIKKYLIDNRIGYFLYRNFFLEKICSSYVSYCYV